MRPIPRHGLILLLALVSGPDVVFAQATMDLGLPPASGSQNPVLPPPSGSQNPVLPPPSGQRYVPGIGGSFGEVGVAGSLSPETKVPASAELSTLADVAPALRRCWTPPVMDGGDAQAMATVRFSLRRNGTLFGQPRVSWGTKRTDPALRSRFTQSVIRAVRDCTPLRLSPTLGASIAGRPMSIRFHGLAPSTERQI